MRLFPQLYASQTAAYDLSTLTLHYRSLSVVRCGRNGRPPPPRQGGVTDVLLLNQFREELLQ